MGVNVYNLNLICDRATPDKRTVVELHMEFPIPYGDLAKVQAWLDQEQWDEAGSYLTGKYSEHRELIADWLANSKARSEGVFERHPLRLAAVG